MKHRNLRINDAMSGQTAFFIGVDDAPDDGSRMSREDHIRFCESAEVKLLRATHPRSGGGAGENDQTQYP